MGRTRKTRDGYSRSVLLRGDQAARITELADELGHDFSDVVRGLIDWVLPDSGGRRIEMPPRAAREGGPSGEVPAVHATVALIDPGRRAQTRATLERLWREVRHTPALARAVLDGWPSNTLVLPTGGPVSAQGVRVAKEVVRLIHLLHLEPPGVRPDVAAGWLIDDWASRSPDSLLDVLASPGVRVVRVDRRSGRPETVLVSLVLARAAGAAEAPPEAMYAAAASGLADLVRQGVLAVNPVPLPWAGFRVNWKKVRDV